jgi:hypothetical protein
MIWLRNIEQNHVGDLGARELIAYKGVSLPTISANVLDAFFLGDAC